MNKRRDFIKLSTLAGAGMVLPLNVLALESDKSVTFGLIADVHKDVMHDADERLQDFINAANKRELDYIIQLGDFCRPYDYNKSFLDVWNSYQGEKYHVIGNHDMDGGFKRSQAMEYWGMESNYYSFNKKGFHFVVLDGNDPNPKPWSGYNRYIAEEQLRWLKDDLEQTNLPTVIFSHQSLEFEDEGVDNMVQVRALLEVINMKAGFQKVLCCISGHSHTDFATKINDIYYVQINSASYYWVGEKYKKVRYSAAIDEKYPWIKYTYPYKESLYTFIKIKDNKIIIEPRETTFVGPGPKEMNGPHTPENCPIVPKISKHKFDFRK